MSKACKVCGATIYVELDQWVDFKLIAYCSECDQEYDPRDFVPEEVLKNLGQLGIYVQEQDYE